MKKTPLGFAIILGFLLLQPPTPPPQEPGGRPEDAFLALSNPDEYAWQLFFYLNRQAEAGRAGVPDPHRTSFADYADDTDTVWETWALVSGGEENLSEVFKDPAIKPDDWAQLRKRRTDKVLSFPFKSASFKDFLSRVRRTSPHSGSLVDILKAPDALKEKKDETRINRALFETIREEHLYSIEGVEEKYRQAQRAGDRMIVRFPKGAKVVKARWFDMSATTDRSQYHWRTVKVTKRDGSTEDQVWGLAGFHIITRDLPNWFWADFNHVNFEAPALLKPRDTTTRGDGAVSGHDGIRRETKGTKWENYILRGTQVNFVDSMGKDTLLSNPLIEAKHQVSSCITCHARAAVALRSSHLCCSGDSLPENIGKEGMVHLAPNPNDLGTPDYADFLAGKRSPQYLQTDFVWSIPFRAFSENSSPTPNR